jgi:hypothetical protein
MALGTIDTDTRRKVFLSISHGKVVHYLTGGEQEFFKNIEGTLQDITIKERSFNGKNTPFWYLDIKDGRETYSLSLPYASGTFKSIILSLASYSSLSKETRVLIEPYERNGYTKVVVYAEGEKLDWVVKELPPLKQVTVGSNTYTDDTERMNFIRNTASQVRERIGKGRL